MGIQLDSRRKRRATGGKRAQYRKHRKFLLGRPQAKTKLGEPRVRRIRVRGGNTKLRALRLDSGIFSWASEGISRKTRILGVVYNGANNEFVRTNTLVKGEIVQIDATPFRLWYEAHYGVGIGRKIPSIKTTKRHKRAEGEAVAKTEKKKKNPKRIYFKFAPKAVLNKIKAYKARKARAIVRAAARNANKKDAKTAKKDAPKTEQPAKPAAAPGKKAAAKPAAPAAKKPAAPAKAGAKAAPKAAVAKKPAAAAAKKPAAAAAKKPAAPKAAAAKKPAAPKKPTDAAAAKKPADASAKKSATKKPAAKKTTTAAAAKAAKGAVETRSRSVILKLKRRAKVRILETHFEEQFVGGRLLAAITSRPGQTGRIDGYLLEGKELEFYVKKTQKKKRN